MYQRIETLSLETFILFIKKQVYLTNDLASEEVHSEKIIELG